MNSDDTNSKLKTQNSKLVDSGWLEVGTIVAPQGLGGEVRVYSNSDFPERFEAPGERWLLCPGETEPRAIKLLKGRYIPGKGLFAVELAGVEDRSQAEALRGCRLLVPESDRPKLGEDEYHVLDLIGLEVFNQLTQEVLGKVVNVFQAGNDLLEVETLPATSLLQPSAIPAADESDASRAEVVTSKRRTRPKSPKPTTVLIPFVKAIVPVVDLAAGRVEITPPPGLLEIT